MNGSLFDQITKMFSESVSRRNAMGVILGMGTATVLGDLTLGVVGEGDGAYAKKKNSKNKGKKDNPKTHECDKDRDCKQPGEPCEVAVCRAHKCKKEKLPICITTVTPSNMGSWQFFDDKEDEPIGPSIVEGPGEPPLGIGSAHLEIDGDSEGELLSARIFRGTPIANFETLDYSTFVAESQGTAPSLQLGIDRNGDDPQQGELYQGRLVFVPSASASQDVEIGEWQTWNVLDQSHGAAWGVTKDFNNPTDETCRLGKNACTLQEVLVAFPGIRINTMGPSPDNDGAGWGLIGFKVGSGEGAVDANVDALAIKVAGENTTTVFTFEP